MYRLLYFFIFVIFSPFLQDQDGVSDLLFQAECGNQTAREGLKKEIVKAGKIKGTIPRLLWVDETSVQDLLGISSFSFSFPFCVLLLSPFTLDFLLSFFIFPHLSQTRAKRAGHIYRGRCLERMCRTLEFSRFVAFVGWMLALLETFCAGWGGCIAKGSVTVYLLAMACDSNIPVSPCVWFSFR